MAGTFSQIYIQMVFAVQNRNSIINKAWEEELYKYITGIIQNKGQSCLSDLVREIKKSSNEFIKAKSFTRFKFQWQEGYGAFSYSHSSLDSVIAYINNQKEHHKKSSFKDEYKEFLTKFQIEHKDEYLFEWFD